MGAAENQKATELVIAILADPIIAKVKFKFGAKSVTPAMYAKVSKAISDSEITVVVDGAHMAANIGAIYHNVVPLPGGKEMYDIMVLKSESIGTTVSEQFTNAGYIIHESTHAAFDLLKTKKMTNFINEAVAYIAASLFMVAKMKDMGGHPDRVTANISEPIAKAAWSIALLVVGGKSITQAAKNALNVAISNSDEYKDKVKAIVIHDGVGKKWKI